MTGSTRNETDGVGVEIREAIEADRHAIVRLFADDEMTTPEEIAALYDRYEADPESKLWVAIPSDRDDAIGLVSIWRVDDHVAELKRLRVLEPWRRRGIGARLIETALAYCRDHAYLKITLDAYDVRAGAIKLFERFGFEHTRTRDDGARKVLDFYLNLYRDVHQ